MSTKTKELPLETQAFLGHLVPSNCETVKYNPVKAGHLVFDMKIRNYRPPYDSEIGMELRRFLSVVREKR